VFSLISFILGEHLILSKAAMESSRRLAAILFTDIVGSTAIMQKDEQIAVSVNKRYVDVLRQSVLSHGGEIVNDYGDGSLCIFSSATEALRCAMEMQKKFQEQPKVPLRIGLHVGEVFFENGKVFGDGVNVASRVQSLGIANSILFSSEICSKIKNQQEFKSVSVGRFHFKNVEEPMEVFALTNEGLTVPKKEELTGKLKEIEKKSVLRKWITAVVAILLLIGSFFIYQPFFHASGFTGEKTIAVLPFENSGEPDSEEYISDGITQDIINNLSKISSLQKVIGWFSVRSFKKTTKNLKQIADELGVAAILSGTIQKHEGKLHIIAELIEVSTNKRLWGDEFEYENKDILSIQTKVAEEIVTALKANVTPEEKKNLSKHNTENVEAYKLYRKGLYFWNKRTKESFDSAEVYYKKALDLDPEYALAYSGLADCYALNNKNLSAAEALPIAKAYLAKALALDSNLAEAWTTVGFIKSHFEYDWIGGKQILEKAIRLNPNYPTAHLYYGNIFIFNGDAERGINEVKKALELDPLSISLNWSLGNRYYDSRKYDLAIAQFQKTLELDPNYAIAKEWIGFSFSQQKKYTQAIDIFSKLPATIPERGGLLSYAYAIAGDKARAKMELDKSLKEEVTQSPFLFYCLAVAYIGLENYSEALTQLEKVYEMKGIAMTGLKVLPELDPLRNEPRFKALLKKANLE
jgi:class 3 adenylate cyclase/TolB-like protein/cytochrome c-type biogenesis protein CcmH/NrfG